MNQIVRTQGGMPAVGTRDGSWVWDGSNWVCDPDCFPPSGCPPFGPPVFSGPVNQPPWYPGANGGVSFGSVAPPNPVRGHMWWDGVTFWLFDGAAWVPISSDGGGGTVPGTGSYQVTTFTTPGSFNFTIPSNVSINTTFKFRLIGGGGGGGAVSPSGVWGGQGGGGGEFKEVGATGLIPGALVACTVPSAGNGGAAATGSDGTAGGDAQIAIASTNTTIVAKGGAGGWGDLTSINGAGQGLGGGNGVFAPGTANIVLVMSVPGGDAHFANDQLDQSVQGASSFLGQGGPAFNNAAGWNDTTNPRGYGAGGRGGYNLGDNGGNGTGGLIVIERFKN